MMTITEAVLLAALPATFVLGALLGAIRTARVMRTLHAHDVANCNDCMDLDAIAWGEGWGEGFDAGYSPHRASLKVDESPVAPV